MKTGLGLFVFAFFLLALISRANILRGDEGMWVYNNLPVKHLKEKYGFEPTAEWAEHVMRSSVRFNSGGSGSFVSSTGLVLTNHHVGADTLHKVSSAGHDYYREGFYARRLQDERKAPDLELNQLVSIEDVTERVNAAVTAEMSPSRAFAARQAAIANVEKESTDKTGLRSDVVTLYQGGQYHLYRYKKYTDVRLVFAPEFDIAFFGGDPDNFEYPRYDLDMCIFRVYENDKPAKIDHFLRWSETGPAENELVFVSGHPGRTSRLLTVAALQFLRDHRVPFTMNLLRRREITLQQYSNNGDEPARRAKEELFSIQNSRKAYLGRSDGLLNPAFFEAKARFEQDLRKRVDSDPKLKSYASAWDRIAAVQPEYAKVLLPRSLFELGSAFDSHYFVIARTLVRMAAEDQKPNAERLREFNESARESMEQSLFSEAPLYADLEQAKLADSLTFFAEQLGADHPMVQKVLAGKSPAARADELVRGTRLGEVSYRREIARGGAVAIEQSTDAMIALAKLVDEPAREARKFFEVRVEEPERQAYGQIAKSMFAAYGTSVYPDATFTLRLAFGQVKGYTEHGSPIPPWTTIGGAFEHESAHGAKDPWKLPSRWHQRKDQLDMSAPFNFVCTADIIGGNSGSPVFNRKAELVGLIFDGNIQSLTADYAYEDTVSRAVSVHCRAMKDALVHAYDAAPLASELGR